jgi:hypothetical protein
MPDTYSIRRSRFPAPAPAEIVAGPVLIDASGSMVMTDRFQAGQEGAGALVPGRFAFKRDGLVFLPEKLTDLEEAAELTDSRAMDAWQPPVLVELAAIALRVHAKATNPYTTDDYLADPRAFLVPFLDVVEVSTVRIANVTYDTVVTCEDVDGGRRAFRFQSTGATGSRRKGELLAWAVISQRINRDIQAAEDAVAQEGLAPYLAEARELAGGGRAEGGGDEELVLAQARQLRRSALRERGTTVVAEARAGMTRLLADLLPEYRRIEGIEGMLAPEHLLLLP